MYFCSNTNEEVLWPSFYRFPWQYRLGLLLSLWVWAGSQDRPDGLDEYMDVEPCLWSREDPSSKPVLKHVLLDKLLSLMCRTCKTGLQWGTWNAVSKRAKVVGTLSPGWLHSSSSPGGIPSSSYSLLLGQPHRGSTLNGCALIQGIAAVTVRVGIEFFHLSPALISPLGSPHRQLWIPGKGVKVEPREDTE